MSEVRRERAEERETKASSGVLIHFKGCSRETKLARIRTASAVQHALLCRGRLLCHERLLCQSHLHLHRQGSRGAVQGWVKLEIRHAVCT